MWNRGIAGYWIVEAAALGLMGLGWALLQLNWPYAWGAAALIAAAMIGAFLRHRSRPKPDPDEATEAGDGSSSARTPASRRSGVRLFCALFAISAALACDVTEPESQRVVLYVAPERVECTLEGTHMCLLVKEDAEEEWSRFYDSIEGFAYEPGFLYKLLVSRQSVDNPPADGSSLTWQLIEVLEKIRS